MVRSDLIKRLASDNPDLSEAEVERIVAAIFDTITDALAKGGRVELRGFGIFTTKVMPSRTGVVPKTGERRRYPGRTLPKFKPAKQMLARLNQVR